MKLTKELINSQKLDDWIRRGKNILFIGERGVGKTAAVREAFKRVGFNYLYLPGSTLDPYLDFVGLPRIQETNDGADLQFIHRKELENIDYLFIDEYNRAPKKVRNGCMEIIQFGTINGVPLPRLKGVIAAINPQDPEDSYDVEDLDKAQFDRFHIKCQVPYDLCQNYMTKRFGEELAETAIVWWKGLKPEIQAAVSPRNLDYALQEYEEGGDLKDVFDPNNKGLMQAVSVLNKQLSAPPIHLLLKQAYDKKDKKKAKMLMTDDSHRHQAHEVIRENSNYMDFFLPYYPKEVLAQSLLEKEFLSHIINNFGSVKEYSDVILDYVKTNPDAAESKQVREIVSGKFLTFTEKFKDGDDDAKAVRIYTLENSAKNPLSEEDFTGLFGKLNYSAEYYTKNSDSKQDFELHAVSFMSRPITTEDENVKIWEEFIQYVPVYSNLTVDGANRGLELMEKLTQKVDPKDNDANNANFFDDTHTQSLRVFNALVSKLVSSTGINKTELSTLYPELTKEYSFMLTDAEVGFPEALPQFFLQEK